jgi:hypothetical protein
VASVATSVSTPAGKRARSRRSRRRRLEAPEGQGTRRLRPLPV